MYIFVAKYNEYVNFGDKNGIAFYFYTLQLYCFIILFCPIIDRLPSFTVGQTSRI